MRDSLLLWGSSFYCLAHLICFWFNLFVVKVRMLGSWEKRSEFSGSKPAAFCTCPSLRLIFFGYFIITIAYTWLICIELVLELSAGLQCLLNTDLLFSVWHADDNYWKSSCLVLQLQLNSSASWFSVAVSVGALQPNRELRLWGLFSFRVFIYWFYYIIRIFSSGKTFTGSSIPELCQHWPP